ncbi:heat shock protein Hsp20 [Clostridium sp. CAG:448]|nr:heat shock protein Hsp20 [Clostridium sp. CAG:448]
MLNRKNNLVSYYNPFREMEMLERSLFGTPVTTSMSFRTDITDEGNMYKLEADLPGFKKEDIQLNVENEVLTIHAERHSEHEDEQKRGKYVCYERVSGSVGRSFDISEIDADKITASYKDGVLTLLLPKKEKVVPTAKRLEIQ